MSAFVTTILVMVLNVARIYLVKRQEKCLRQKAKMKSEQFAAGLGLQEGKNMGHLGIGSHVYNPQNLAPLNRFRAATRIR